MGIVSIAAIRTSTHSGQAATPNHDNKAWVVGEAAKAAINPEAMNSLVKRHQRNPGMELWGAVQGGLGGTAGVAAIAFIVGAPIGLAPFIAGAAAGGIVGYAAINKIFGSDEDNRKQAVVDASKEATSALAVMCGNPEGIALENAISPKALERWRSTKAEVCSGAEHSATSKKPTPHKA